MKLGLFLDFCHTSFHIHSQIRCYKIKEVLNSRVKTIFQVDRQDGVESPGPDLSLLLSIDMQCCAYCLEPQKYIHRAPPMNVFLWLKAVSLHRTC